MAKAKTESKNNNNGANLGFEAKLFLTADKLRGNMDASEYKHVALGLIFLKYISDLQDDLSDAEDPEEYLAENVFWIPKEARWSHLQDNARQATIGKITDDAMLLLEASFPTVEEVEAELGKVSNPLEEQEGKILAETKAIRRKQDKKQQQTG